MKRNIVTALALAVMLAAPAAAFAGHGHRNSQVRGARRDGFSAAARSFAAPRHTASAFRLGNDRVNRPVRSARPIFNRAPRTTSFAGSMARFRNAAANPAPLARGYAPPARIAGRYHGYNYASAPAAGFGYQANCAANQNMNCDADGDDCGPARAYTGAYNSGYAAPYYQASSIVQMPGESLLAYRARLIAARDYAKFRARRARLNRNGQAASHWQNRVHSLNVRIAQVNRELGYASNSVAPAYASTAYNYGAYGPGYSPYGSSLGGAAAMLTPMLQQIVP